MRFTYANVVAAGSYERNAGTAMVRRSLFMSPSPPSYSYVAPAAAGIALAAALATLAFAVAPAGAAAPAPPAAVPGQLVIGFHDGVSADRRRALRGTLRLRRIRPLFAGARADLVAVPERSATALAARGRELEAEPGVAYAEPNWVVTPDLLPSDPLFATQQWDLRNTGSFMSGNTTVASTAGADIDAPRAWDLTTGSPNVVIAVVDTGIYAAHQDLDGQLWTNPGERSNGVDDDGNGLVDDLPGWDFASNDANPDDSQGHGTHVAGTAGGEANGLGTVGVAWKARIMRVRSIGGDPNNPLIGNAADIADGLRYAASEGARVVNMSFGSAGESSAITDSIVEHPGALFVAAAGNGNSNNDGTPVYPCNSAPSNIVCVANSDKDDNKSSTSSYGPTTVDLAAPGTQIISANGAPATRAPNSYVVLGGTSMAVPHVTGIAALIKSFEPWHGPLAQKACILAGVDRTPGLNNLVATDGRANARRALEACADRSGPEVAPVQIAPPAGARVRPSVLSFRFAPGRDAFSGVATNSILVDGRPVASGPASAGALLPSARIADGRHVWVARSTDRFGNFRDSAARSLIVDGTRPRMKLKIRRRSAARGIKGTAKLSESVKITSAKIKLSRKVARKLRSRKRTFRGKATKKLAKGKHTLKIKLPKALRRRGAGHRVRFDLRLVDRAGNVAHKRFAVTLK